MLVFALGFIIGHNKTEAAYITGLIINAEIMNLVKIFMQAFLSVIVLILTVNHLFKLVVAPWKILKESEIKYIRNSYKNIVFSLKSQRYILTFFYIITTFIVSILNASIYIIIFIIDNPVQKVFAYTCIIVLMFVFLFINLALISEIKLRYYIAEMANGHIDTIPKQRGIFTNSINRLNCINMGFKANIEKTLKSERLKTDLITNVSHDLKTPLTSIINYIDLLKELDLDSEKAIEYIDIVDKKSRRLKILIEDLFEASKLSSGQMELEIHPTDILALLNQTMGELSDRMEEAGITFKVNEPNHPVIIKMDGQRMWRVFDNMFNNILKYSPTGSRAYVDVEDNVRNVVITLKNVANYPMDFDADELFERFKRGDKARTTEGSGLGLSIAKGIVELHGGKMKIITDGDLFKMIITLYK
jgi:signal transduction histidine kinase